MNFDFSVETLRAIAECSEDALLTLAHGMAVKRDAQGLQAVLEMVRIHGFPGPITKEYRTLRITHAATPEDISLPRSVLECLREPSVKASLLMDMGAAYKAYGRKNHALFDSMLFDAAEIHRADVAHMLMDMGAKADVFHTVYITGTAQGDTRSVTAPVKCLLEGNAEQAIAHIDRGGDEVAQEIVNSIVAGYTNAKSVFFKESAMLVTQLIGDNPIRSNDSLGRLLSRLEESLGTAKVAPARAQLLSSYLLLAQSNQRAWKEDEIETLLGGSLTRNPVTALCPNPHNKVDVAFRRPADMNIWQEIVRRALTVHCAPVVQTFLPVAVKQKKSANMVDLMGCIMGLEGPFDAQRMHETVQVLAQAGHPINPEDGKSSAFHRLALASMMNRPFILEKLKVLLEAGGDPQASAVDRPQNIALDNLKEPWMDVVHAFAARTHAQALLKTMDADEKPISLAR